MSVQQRASCVLEAPGGWHDDCFLQGEGNPDYILEENYEKVDAHAYVGSAGQPGFRF